MRLYASVCPGADETEQATAWFGAKAAAERDARANAGVAYAVEVPMTGRARSIAFLNALAWQEGSISTLRRAGCEVTLL